MFFLEGEKMNTYTYYDNSKSWHGKLLLVVYADTITDADKIFEKITGLNTIKCPRIGCVIDFAQAVV